MKVCLLSQTSDVRLRPGHCSTFWCGGWHMTGNSGDKFAHSSARARVDSISVIARKKSLIEE